MLVHGTAPMRVLITDSDNRSALAATRSVGKLGHTVITAGEHNPSLASVSRYSSAHEVCPSPTSDPEGFVAALLEIVRRQRIDVVLPMTEVTTLLVTQHRAELPPSCVVPFADPETIANASNKAWVLRSALQLGVPIPATEFIDSPQDALRLADTLAFPVVVKPARSRVRTANGWLSAAVSYAEDRDAFRARIAQLREQDFPLLIQERIVGPGVGVFACYAHGQPIAWFAHRRIREKPPSGGVSVLSESAALDPVAVDYASRLLSHLRWHGVAMVEFKRDTRDGSLRLMEINGRFWGSLQLAIDAGVDFPALAMELAAGRPVAPQRDYRVGVRCRWFWGDLDALLLVLLKSRDALNLPAAHPGRWRSLLSFLRPGSASQREELLRKDDPRPWLLESRRRLLRSR